MRASDGEWHSLSYLRETECSAREVQYALALGFLESNRKPNYPKKWYRITGVGLNALKTLNMSMKSMCVSPQLRDIDYYEYHRGFPYKPRYHRFELRYICYICQKFEFVEIKPNLDWIMHCLKYKW